MKESDKQLSYKDNLELRNYLSQPKDKSMNPSGCDCSYSYQNEICDCRIDDCLCKQRHRMSFAQYVGSVYFKQAEMERERLIRKGVSFVNAAKIVMKKYGDIVESPNGHRHQIRQEIIEENAARQN